VDKNRVKSVWFQKTYNYILPYVMSNLTSSLHYVKNISTNISNLILRTVRSVSDVSVTRCNSWASRQNVIKHIPAPAGRDREGEGSEGGRRAPLPPKSNLIFCTIRSVSGFPPK